MYLVYVHYWISLVDVEIFLSISTQNCSELWNTYAWKLSCELLLEYRKHQH